MADDKVGSRTIWEIVVLVVGAMSGVFALVTQLSSSGANPAIAALAVGLVLSAALVVYKKWSIQTAGVTWSVTSIVIVIVFFLISQPATVTGQVIRNDTTPVGGLRLVLTNSNGIEQNVVTDSEGRFEIRNVPDGRYTITADSQLLFTGNVPSGWQRIWSPSVSIGGIIAFDNSVIASNNTVPANSVVSPSYTPTYTPTSQPIDTLSPTATPSTSSTPTIRPTQTPRPTATPILPGMVLFEEDFEDGSADGFRFQEGNWQVVDDGTGNSVLELDNVSPCCLSLASFGSPNWANYSITYRFRVLESSDIGNLVSVTDLIFRIQGGRFNGGNTHLYRLGFFAGCGGGGQIDYVEGENYEGLTEINYLCVPNTWTRVRLELQGPSIRVTVNDDLIADLEDTRANAGNAGLSVTNHVYAQFDDIKVVALAEE